MKKLEKISPEQESRIPEWVEKWVKIGLSTEPADFDKAILAATKAYSLYGLDKPLVILRMGSPYAAVIGEILAYEILEKGSYSKTENNRIWNKFGGEIRNNINDLISYPIRDQVGTQIRNLVLGKVWDEVWAPIKGSLRTQVNNKVINTIQDRIWDQVSGVVRGQISYKVLERTGVEVKDQIRSGIADILKGKLMDWEGLSSLWCHSSSYFTFFRDVCGIELPPDILVKISITEDLVTSCGYTLWSKNVLVISDRPKKINFDAEGRLHCENGPSIEYRDGWSLYHWHGVSIPEEWVTTKKPTAKEALTWENIEQRRAACEIIGWVSVLKELDAKTIDEDGDPEIGTLVECSIPDSGEERFLRVLCGTSREFVIPVPREMKTAIEANSWTWGLSSNEYRPEVRT